MADEKPKIISVLPGPATEGRKVGIWDVDKAHPGGEAWVAPGADSDKEPKPVEVAETGAVLQALTDGRLVRAGSPEAKALEAPRAGAK
jgi:hypothetical protein